MSMSISQYPVELNEVSGDDFIEVSEEIGPGSFATRKFKPGTMINADDVALADHIAYVRKNKAWSPVGDNLVGFKNAIANGGFTAWNRGTSFDAAASTRYSADAWKIIGLGSDTIAASRQAFTLGQVEVPGEPAYFHRAVVVTASGAGDGAQVQCTIKNVRRFAGQKCTLSYYAKVDSNKSISSEVSQFFGTGGAPSASVTGIGVNKVAVTPTFARFSKTIDMPAITSKTLGTAEDDAIIVNFWLSAGASFDARTNSLGNQSGTFDIAFVQLEAGAVATTFDVRPAVIEKALYSVPDKTLQALGTIATSTTIDLLLGNVVSCTIAGNLTFTFANPPATGNVGTFTMIVTNGTAFAITWPGAVVWDGGSVPALQASGVDILEFTTINGGTTWYGRRLWKTA